MSTVGSTGAVSSTAQQDRVASGNSQQARRSSGDSRVFANMLAAAADQATPESQAENNTQAHKQDAGRQRDPDVDPGRSPPADNGPLSRLIATADNQPTQDKPQASEEQGQLPRRAAQGGRAWSTLALVGRDTALAQRAASAASQAVEDAGTGAAAPSLSAAAAAGAAGLSPSPTDGHSDSQGAAFAAALEDALDVSDDVTLTATVSTDIQSSASDGPDTAVGALTQAESRDSEALTGTEAPPNAAADAEAFQNSWADAMERVGQQVSYWLGKGVSQAQLTVHGGQGDSVDVRVLLRGGQAHLEFLSNHEATREAIAQHGAEALRTVLGDSGLDLASLRVDAQAQQSAGMGQGTGQNSGHDTRNPTPAGQAGSERSDGSDQHLSAPAPTWTTTALLDTFA